LFFCSVRVYVCLSVRKVTFERNDLLHGGLFVAYIGQDHRSKFKQKEIKWSVRRRMKAFWATVCKTVRPMLSDRCLSCLSVTLVYCGQTVEWIKMKLGIQVGLGPGHIVLDGDIAPLPQWAHPNFRPMFVMPNGWMDQDATWYF